MEKYTIEWHYDGFDFIFNTLDTLFSYKQIDVGTIQMIESVSSCSLIVKYLIWHVDTAL